MGSFNPPHNGHLAVIDQALREREKLHLFVRYNDGVDLTSREVKQKWFDRISAERDNRVVVHMFSTDDMKGKDYNGDIFVRFLRLFEESLGEPIDEVWVGDKTVPLVAQAQGQLPNVVFRITERTELNSTAIRKDLETHRSWLPDFVYEDLIHAGKDRALRACAVVQRKLHQLLGLRYGFAVEHLDRAEIALGESFKINEILEQRFNLDVREVDFLRFDGHLIRLLRSHLPLEGKALRLFVLLHALRLHCREIDEPDRR